MKPEELPEHLKETYEEIEEAAIEAEDLSDILSISEVAERIDKGRSAARKRIDRLEEKNLVKIIPSPGSATLYVHANFDQTLDPVKQRKEKLQKAKQNLEVRILREPTIKEVAEELGEPYNHKFEKELLASVDDYSGDPKEDRIEYAKKELEGRLRRCLTLYHGVRPEDVKPENLDSRPVGKEYLEKNEDIFEDFTLTCIGYNEHGQAKIRVEPPNYISKFLENPKFILSTTSPEQFDLDYGEDMI